MKRKAHPGDRGRYGLAALFGLLCVGAAAPAAASAQGAIMSTLGTDLSNLSLEDLANVEITSVSRRPESLSEAAAAVYVITAEDIRRSGAASLPEVLRLAPNLQVQRVDSVNYAITARGFNGFETSNKLLVLVDGRSVYSLLHSGVFWDMQGVVLEDIERIEVISGPGGALYGANAVNGVINIITRSAAETQGTLVALGAGNEDRTLSVRYGGKLGEGGGWRAFVMAFDREESRRLNGLGAGDEVSGVQGGFRADWAAGANTFNLQGDLYRHDVIDGAETEGGNLVGRWGRTLAGGSVVEVQGYYDRTQRTDGPEREIEGTWDVRAQHTVSWGSSHNIVWGGGARLIQSRFDAAPGAGAFLDPADRDISLTNLFFQDQIALRDDLTLTLGVKFEDSSLSGDEVLPNARLAWRPRENELVWASVARAVRTPNRIERDLTAPGFLINGFFQTETLIAVEAGYRARPRPDLSFSVSAFYNEYEDLRSLAIDLSNFTVHFGNDVIGHTSGIEAWGSYDIGPRWRLSAGATTLEKDFKVRSGEFDLAALASTGDDPEYRLTLRSQHSLGDAVDLDVRLRAVDELSATSTDGYVEADVRLGWRVNEELELAVAGNNLLDDSRLESGDPNRARLFGRSVYATLRWRP